MYDNRELGYHGGKDLVLVLYHFLNGLETRTRDYLDLLVALKHVRSISPAM